jgi:hypothetical protein
MGMESRFSVICLALGSMSPYQIGEGKSSRTGPIIWRMVDYAKHPLTLSGRDPVLLRGDPITGDRYYSKEFAQRDWDHMWTKI